MALGFLLVFAPALALQAWLHPSLAGIWLAKAALNVWRLGGAAYLIYWRFLPRFGLEERGGPQRRHGDERQEEGGAGHEA